MRPLALPALLAALLLVSACTGDLSSRGLAYLANGSLYVSRLDGSGAITVSHDVQSFRWGGNGSDLEFATRHFSDDSTRVTVTRVTVPLTEVESYVRDQAVTEQDTLQVSPSAPTTVSADGVFRYSMEGDTLVIDDAEGERRRIAGVTRYELHPNRL